MSMTRKDYELIARALRFEYGLTIEDKTGHRYQRQMIVHLAVDLAQDNPERFDFGKFLEAATGEERDV